MFIAFEMDAVVTKETLELCCLSVVMKCWTHLILFNEIGLLQRLRYDYPKQKASKRETAICSCVLLWNWTWTSMKITARRPPYWQVVDGKKIDTVNRHKLQLYYSIYFFYVGAVFRDGAWRHDFLYHWFVWLSIRLMKGYRQLMALYFISSIAIFIFQLFFCFLLPLSWHICF